MFVWITLTGQTEAGVQVPSVFVWLFRLSAQRRTEEQREEGESGVLFFSGCLRLPVYSVQLSQQANCGEKKKRQLQVKITCSRTDPPQSGYMLLTFD